ncbi:SDR family NAD(P)-dependent oxidoreductase [Enemella dayhoffiae]|nr:SDR family oxidoreductase [Enemella dayhoffiae]
MSVLQDRAVVVTGAGGGIGRAYAEAIVAAGGRVVVNDIAHDRAVEVAEGLGGQAVPSGHDITDWDQARDLVRTCVTEFGTIDGLVNNAGLLALAHPHEQDERDARRLIEVNLMGSIACATAAFAEMVPRGRGSVVNVTSGQQMGDRSMAVYGATKAGTAALTYSWATDLRESGVRVNAVSPMAHTRMAEVYESFVGGGFVGQNRGKDPANNAPLVVWLLSDRSARVTGQVLRCDAETLSVCAHPAVIAEGAQTEGGWDVDKVQRAFDERLLGLLQPGGVRLIEPPRFVDGPRSAGQ